MLQNPLSNIHNLSELLNLPYFDLLGCIGFYSIHPGGLSKTKELIRDMKLSSRDSLLEIGSGNGFTSAALLKSGASLTIVDPVERLLAAALRNCKIYVGKVPNHFNCKAEDLPDNLRFSTVLMEAVYGFIADKVMFHQKLDKLLENSGNVGVIDFYYHTMPAPEVLTRMKAVFGSEFIALSKEDWVKNFESLSLKSWIDFKTSDSKLITEDLLYQSLEKSHLITNPIFNEPRAVQKITHTLNCYNDLFNENKKYMHCFSAIWQKQTV